jgi:hypothetical protein
MFWLTSPSHVGAEVGDGDGGTYEQGGWGWVAQGQTWLLRACKILKLPVMTSSTRS